MKTDNEAPDFPALALFLSKTYGQMLKDREQLKAVIDAGVPVYTEEMAIRDLSAISIDYESDRVQTSSISNVPERIAELLDNGYVEKMNRKLRREMAETVKGYSYLCWKIEVVETDMRDICARIHIQPAEKSMQKETVQPSDLRSKRGGVKSSLR